MNFPTEQHLGAAFRDLVADQPFTPDAAAIEHHARRSRRQHRIVRGGIGAGAVAVAAVAAVGLASAVPSAGKAPASSAASSAGAPQPLAQLAAMVAAQPKPKGDATLVERESGVPGSATINVWDLYTDKGEYFFSRTKAGLPAQVKKDNNQADGQFAREVAAAVYAVNGDLDHALLQMAWSPNGGPAPSWLSAQVKDISAGGLQLDNYVWEQSEDALVAGAGNPQVRAGVLRLVSALPGITVTHGTVDGQPALTLTAGAAELGRTGVDKANPKAQTGPAYHEAISINAKTGIPLQLAAGPTGKVAVGVTYVVQRVSLASIASGQF